MAVNTRNKALSNAKAGANDRDSIPQHAQQQRHRPPRPPSTFEIYKTAARPHTLTASLCPCLVALAACQPDVTHWCVWVLFCATVQLGTNLHNDYADFVKGADTDKRVGQARATAQGWLTPAETCRAATLTLLITAVAGVYLLVSSRQTGNAFAWFLICTSVINAFAYTGGPYPLGYIGLGNVSIAYAGLGDVFVFLYFGLTGTLFLPYLQAASGEAVDWPRLWLYATQVGLLATNIIVVNNLRDRHTDVAADKHTTAVRFGRVFSLTEYMFCLGVTYALVVVDVFVYADFAVARLLPLVSLPLALKELKAVVNKDGSALNAHVGGTAKVQFLFCILLSIGLWATR